MSNFSICNANLSIKITEPNPLCEVVGFDVILRVRLAAVKEDFPDIERTLNERAKIAVQMITEGLQNENHN